MLRAETAADANAEARADHEIAAKAAPVAPPRVEARTDRAAAAKEPASVAGLAVHAVEPARAATPAPARTAAVRHVPPAPAARQFRVVSLPLTADVARAFAALPHGSALSVDAVADKATGPSKKVELAADDVDEARSRKPVGGESGRAEADRKESDKTTGGSDKGADAAAKTRATPSDTSSRTKTAGEGSKAKSFGERYWVQVAGGANKADLGKAWDKLRTGPAKSVLAGQTPSTTPLRFTNRLLVGPFGDMGEAQSFVNKLAAAGISSFTFKSAAGQKIDKLQDR